MEINGILNNGNSCYMNSGIQMLLSCKIFNNIINSDSIKFKSNILKLYKDFLNDYYNSNKYVNIINIKKILLSKNNNYNNNEQQDSHEFLIDFIEILENELKKENNIKILNFDNKNITSIIFDTHISSIIYCQDTNEKSKNITKEKILSIPILNKNNINIQNCLDEYSKIEVLKDDYKWKSDKTNNYHNAYKRLYYKCIPKYFIIQLQRFFYDSTKNNKYVEINDEITIHDIRLSLRSFIIHIGNLNYGHYICLKNINNIWYKCDDENIKIINNIKEYFKYAYILLYVKI